MAGLKLVLFCLVISVAVHITKCAPFAEDDEYDDDPELPDRKATMHKLHQKEMEKQQQQDIVAFSTTTTSTTGRPRPLKPKGHKHKRKWVVAKDVRGYQVLTDGPRVRAEMIKTRPMLRISVEMPDHAVRQVDKIYEEQHVELKIRNWNRVHKVHIKVPFGYSTSDLKITELRDRIDIIAPVYSEIDESSSE